MSEETLKRLKARRTQIKAELTRFHTYLDKFEALPGMLTQLQTRFETIRYILPEFKQIQGDYETAQLENDALDEEVAFKERDEFETKYFNAISRAKEFMQELTLQDTAAMPPLTSAPFASGLNISSPNTSAKLPPLKIPEFYGSYSEWQQFHDTFAALVHNNPNLHNIERFYYLQGSLKGEAAQVIASLQISDANYPKAFKLLQDRYENKKAIVNAHLKEIFGLPLIPKESHINLRKFYDTFLRNCRALESLGEPVSSWNTILIYMIISKLDFHSKREWENYSREIDQPSLEDFSKFLNQRCQMLESLESKSAGNRRSNDNSKTFYTVGQEASKVCPLCREKHFIYFCPKFKAMPVESRYEETKKMRLCTNCLRKNHKNFECKSMGCKICSGKHSTLLHQSGSTSNKGNMQNVNSNRQHSNSTDVKSLNNNNHDSIHEQKGSTPSEQGLQNTSQTNHTVLYVQKPPDNMVLLSTAIVRVFNAQNQEVLCRVLLDSGSQSNFITRELAQRLELQTTKINLPISGINEVKTNINQQTTLNLSSLHHNFKIKISCLIIDKITDFSPQNSFDISNLNIPDVQLADANFNVASGVDILIGCSLFFDLLLSGQIKLGKNLPILQNSLLGWLIAGNIPINQKQSKCFFLKSEPNTELSKQIERFWLLEEVPQNKKNILTQEEHECEQHFVENVARNKEGRFVIKLPLRNNIWDLGESEKRALNRLYAMEQKLSKNIELNDQYKAFLREYETLNHMVEITREENLYTPIYYLPHHSVIKPDSVTTKVRVVFDASAKSSTNVSLNDVLKDGPVIQKDLFSILLRFRKHEFVFIGDLTKMYRQILIHPEQINLQRIVWRENPNNEVKHYALRTLTYGTKPASFLATRCLKQITVENNKKFPVECDVINKDMYMDDVLTGASDSVTLNKIRENLSTLLSEYGFEIRKFQSNDINLLKGISQTTDSQYIITDDFSTKTLGVAWVPSLDVFQYKCQEFRVNTNQVTKRTILSFVAKIFDPLGLLGPLVIRFKFLIQSLWRLQAAWDDPVPFEIYNQWIEFQNQISQINLIQIPRHVLIKNPHHIEIHGFSDASERAYGCAIYLRSKDDEGQVECHLLCAKSRVAPVKSITLPRLELCGALLLSRLLAKCLDMLDLKINNVFMWTDSTIVLSWIAGEPRMWKTFVANRVTEIQELGNTKNWHYIASKNNPADIISRGAHLVDLINTSLWWQGPSFLKECPNKWPQNSNIVNFSRNLSNIPEFKPSTSSFLCEEKSNFLDILERFSDYDKLVRIMAYCLRFINNLKDPENRQFGLLTNFEINKSITILLKIVQGESFFSDIKDLKKNKFVSSKSHLKSLSPVLDNEGLLRVGGRLENTNLSYNQKHPIILPCKHPFTRLLIMREHKRSLHAGLHSTLSHVRQNFWPLNGKNTVKSCIRKCVRCFRVRPLNLSVKMGQLPSSRVTPSNPFGSSAVDFAGPFDLKDGKTKNRKIIKAYVCVFVCLATKAVHLELISDLTSEGFLSVLKRFVSRRGLCTDLYSDNATNFTGANNELQAIQNLTNNEFFQNYLNGSQINWHFIPARSPHFGGLWEAAVKSCKHHLKRVLNQTPLTYEEFYTILTQVEAVLNSRPIIPISSDPNDMEALTPGHFLIGRPLTAVPQRDLTGSKVNYVKRYQHMQQIFQHFWSRWVKEYLHILQQRTKWQFGKNPNIKLGSMVLLKEDNIPPLCWPLGRIVALHPGSDNIVRVVSIRTKNGVFKRAIARLSLLPIED